MQTQIRLKKSSDQGLHSLPFHQVICEQMHRKKKTQKKNPNKVETQKRMKYGVQNFMTVTLCSKSPFPLCGPFSIFFHKHIL